MRRDTNKSMCVCVSDCISWWVILSCLILSSPDSVAFGTRHCGHATRATIDDPTDRLHRHTKKDGDGKEATGKGLKKCFCSFFAFFLFCCAVCLSGLISHEMDLQKGICCGSSLGSESLNNRPRGNLVCMCLYRLVSIDFTTHLGFLLPSSIIDRRSKEAQDRSTGNNGTNDPWIEA